MEKKLFSFCALICWSASLIDSSSNMGLSGMSDARRATRDFLIRVPVSDRCYA
jgi:hypothetical protein